MAASSSSSPASHEPESPLQDSAFETSNPHLAGRDGHAAATPRVKPDAANFSSNGRSEQGGNVLGPDRVRQVQRGEIDASDQNRNDWAISYPAQGMVTPEEVAALNQAFQGRPTEEVLLWAWRRFGRRAAIGSSFQGAGLVMMHLAQSSGLPLPVFTLDTGLLFPKTVELKKRLEDFFGIAIESLAPDLTVEEQSKAHGPELWRRDPDLCCTMRKVLPLQGKLAELDCWITGLRRQQSETRATVAILELYVFDPQNGRDIVKLNPMAHWTREAVWQYIRDHRIPYNPLRDQGYRSIGCQPCTRRTNQGEHERAGRWLGFNKVECGIHTFLTKKIDFQI